MQPYQNIISIDLPENKIDNGGEVFLYPDIYCLSEVSWEPITEDPEVILEV